MAPSQTGVCGLEVTWTLRTWTCSQPHLGPNNDRPIYTADHCIRPIVQVFSVSIGLVRWPIYCFIPCHDLLPGDGKRGGEIKRKNEGKKRRVENTNESGKRKKRREGGERNKRKIIGNKRKGR